MRAAKSAPVARKDEAQARWKQAMAMLQTEVAEHAQAHASAPRRHSAERLSQSCRRAKFHRAFLPI
jgi:hypothetical protein